MTRSTCQAWTLAVAILVMGGCGIAYEYTLSKVSSDLLGNSVRQWALVIAVMLFFMGVGAEVQRRVKDQALMSALVGSQILLALLGGFGPLLLILTFAWHPLNFGLVHYGLISTCGLLIGLEIPLITRLNEAYAPTVSKNLGTVLRMDYGGALIGGILWTFLLVPRFTISETSLLLGFLTLAGALGCLVIFRHKTPRFLALLVALIGSIAVLTFAFPRVNQWSNHAEQALYRDAVVHTVTSPYQHIVLTESRAGNLRCYINGHLQFSADDEYIYHELLVHPALLLAEKKQRVLVLGGGDGLAVREVLKHPSVEHVTLVDLDQLVTDLARTHPRLVSLNQNALTDSRVAIQPIPPVPSGKKAPLPGNPAAARYAPNHQAPTIELVHQDAASWIRQAHGSAYDVILLDFPDPSSPGLAKLYGLSFYGQLQKLLTPGGVICQQATSPWHARPAFLCVGETMKAAGLAVLPLHANVPSFGDWGWWLAVPEKQQSSDQLRSTLEKLTSIPVPTRYLDPDTMRASLTFGPGRLAGAGSRITTLNDPAIYFYYLQSWQENL